MKKSLSCLIPVLISLAVYGQCDRSTVINNYNNVYLPSAVSSSDLGWTGNSASCVAGTISDTAMQRSLRRINYFRELCGVPGNIVYDATYSAKAQQAALMMTANNTLSHSPPASWLCFTTDGEDAAGNSNLSLGSHSSGAITAFMNDFGSGNTAAGHRRWILYSRATTFGMGSTSNACALWVFGPTTTSTVDYITFPSEGFFPAPLVPSSNRWSFGKPNADFATATVTMTDENGVNVPVTIEPLANSYGDRTIVFVPTGINTSGPYDTRYTVNISNVMISGNPQNFTYDVIIAQPVHPPACPPGEGWSDTDCACVTGIGIDELAIQNSIDISENPFGSQLRVSIRNIKPDHIRIFNFAGALISELNVGGSQQFTIDSSSWPAGIYFVSVTGYEGNTGTKKVIRQ